MSLGMFSIIPVPKNSWNDKYMPLVIPALPIAGAVIGVIWCGLALALTYISIPLMIKSAIVLFIPFILSGFLHLDGYMDTADAVFSRRSIDEKKRILKDPHIGAFAAVSMTGLLIFQLSAVYVIMEVQENLFILVLIPVISRCIAGFATLNLKPVFETGYNASFRAGTNKKHTIFICFILFICYITAWFTLGTAALPLFAQTAAGFLAVWYLYRQFRGISGDLSGCIITVSELAALICMAVVI